MSSTRSFSGNMPDINNLLKSPSPRRASSPSRTSSSRPSSPNLTLNNLERLLRNSGNTPKPTPKPASRTSSLPMPQFSMNLGNFFSPPRQRVPKARKIAPSPKKAPTPQRVATPDRKFSHLFEGTNSGEKDPMGRIIYHGPRGGKFVISSVGKRVPYVNESLKSKVNKQKMEFTGMLDRKGRKIYKGKSGGKFIMTETGRRANPLL